MQKWTGTGQSIFNFIKSSVIKIFAFAEIDNGLMICLLQSVFYAAPPTLPPTSRLRNLYPYAQDAPRRGGCGDVVKINRGQLPKHSECASILMTPLKEVVFTGSNVA